MATSCRVCRRDDGARTIDVATSSEASQLPISLMLSYCAQIQVSNGEQICSECLMNLETAFNFRKQCRQIYKQETPPVGYKPKKPFQCCVSSCVKTANSLRELVLHSTKMHSKERESTIIQQRSKVVSTSCPICCMGFESIGAMKNHSETQNIRSAKLRCDKCQMICQNPVKYAEHRVERCTGVPTKADGNDSVMECDNVDTNDLDVKMERAMAIVRTGKRFVMKLNESEHYVLTETNYAPKEQLERLLDSVEKTSKIFYICETCNYKTFVKGYILQHVATSQNCQGFYNALGSFEPIKGEPWLSCGSCHFLATNPTSIMQHQSRQKHSGINTVPPQSSFSGDVPNMEQCIEIEEPKLSESNSMNSAVAIKDEPLIAVKVEPIESSSLPVPQPVQARSVAKPSIKTNPNRQKAEPKQRPVEHQILKCRCGLTFPRNTLLQRHILKFCLLNLSRKSPPRYQKVATVPGVKNVLQCDGCLLTLYSPSDVARHKQNHCPAYKRQRLAERSSADSAE